MIRDQGDRQLDLTGKINTENTQGIEFYDQSNKRLRDLAERVKKESKENRGKKFVYTTTSGEQYDFIKHRDSIPFRSEIYNPLRPTVTIWLPQLQKLRSLPII